MRIGFAIGICIAALEGAAFADPLDLTACVRLALAHNPALQDVVDSEVSAILGREVPLAEYHVKAVPAVSGGVQGGNNTNQHYALDLSRKFLLTGTKIEVGGGTSVYSSVPQVSVPYYSDTRITVLQPLWQGRTRLENTERIDDAERRVGAAKHAVASAREDLVLAVGRGFYDVVRADELVGVARTALERVEQLDRIARAKLAMGAVSKMDVFRTELHTTRLQNALVEQQAKRESALDQLRALLGVDASVPLEIDARDATAAINPSSGRAAARSPLSVPPGATLESMTDEALERRPEVAEARAEVADAERKALLAHYKIWPSIDLLGSYARIGTGNNFEDSSHLDRTEWLVGVSTTTPLDRTEERVAASQAEITLKGRERRYKNVREQIVREMREAWRQLERARAERTLALSIVEQTEKQTELAHFRYEKGVTDNFDLVQAETDLAEASSASVLAAIGEVLAVADVQHAAGTLGEAFRETSPAETPRGE